MTTRETASSQTFQPLQRAAGVLMVGTGLLYALGFVKSLLTAEYYGTSRALEAYVLALAPVNLLAGIIAGTVHAALIPTYLDLSARKGVDAAVLVLSAVTCYLMSGLLCAGGLVWLGSSGLAAWLGAAAEPEFLHLTAFLLRAAMALLALMVLEQIGLAFFQAHHRFAIAAFAPLINGGVALWYLIRFHEQGVQAMMYSLLAGLLIENCALAYLGRRYWPTQWRLLPPSHPDVRRIFKTMTPLLLGASFGHVNPLVDQMMAARLPPGSLAALNYAGRLHHTITQIFVNIVSKALLPFLAQKVAQHDRHGLKATFRFTVTRMLMLILPLSLGIFLFSRTLVRFAFQRGAFAPEATAAVSGAWLAYTIGLPVQAVGILTAKVYNALQANTILMYVSAASIVVNIIGNVIGMHYWGHIGIALSTSLVYIFATATLLVLLNRQLRTLPQGAMSVQTSEDTES